MPPGLRSRIEAAREWLDRLSPRVLLLAILGVAALVRLGLVLLCSQHPSRFLTRHDSSEYLTLAHGFDALASTSNPDFALSVRRTPVYPLFLSASHLMTDSRITGPMVMQALVGVGTVYVVYRLGLSLFSQRLGLFAAAFLAIEPLSIVYTSIVMTETLYTLFLASCLLMLWRPRRNHWARGLAAGVLLGLATLTRPVSLLLVVPLAVGYMVLERRDLWSAVLVVLCFLVGFGLLAGGWIVRNYETTGVATLSSIDGDDLLNYRAAGILMESDHLSLKEARHRLALQLAPRLPPKANAAQVSRAQRKLAFEVIRAHPAAYAEAAVKGAWHLLLASGHKEIRTATGVGSRQLASTYSRAYLLCLYLLAAVALWSSRRRHELRYWLLPITTIVYTVVVSSGIEAYSRFRVPLMPFIALLAAGGLNAVLTRDRDSNGDVPARPDPALATG